MTLRKEAISMWSARGETDKGLTSPSLPELLHEIEKEV